MSAAGMDDYLRYKRSRFTARLPMDRLYTGSHYWIRTEQDGSCRVGFTRFASRMLGEIVELDFEVEPQSEIALGQVIGWVEAFKAVADLYCVGRGRFLGGNPALLEAPQLIDRDPHGGGWLYAFEGEPDPDCLDARAYAGVLDTHIDRLLGERDKQHEGSA